MCRFKCENELVIEWLPARLNSEDRIVNSFHLESFEIDSHGSRSYSSFRVAWRGRILRILDAGIQIER